MCAKKGVAVVGYGGMGSWHTRHILNSDVVELKGIWDIDENYVNDNTLSVYVKRLRKKIGDTSDKEIIKTVRGIGYILNK